MNDCEMGFFFFFFFFNLNKQVGELSIINLEVKKEWTQKMPNVKCALLVQMLVDYVSSSSSLLMTLNSIFPDLLSPLS